MFRIGEFSKICQVPVSALRYYADIGLLEPAQIDDTSGYRYYTFEQLPALNRILALKDLGLALNQIGDILQQGVSGEQIEEMLNHKQAELQQAVDETQAQLRRVQTRLDQIYQEGSLPTHDIVTKTVEAVHGLALREIVATPPSVGDLMITGFGALAQHGIVPIGSPFAVFYDMEYKPHDLDVEVVFPVSSKITTNLSIDAEHELVVGESPAFTLAASTVYVGAFANISQAYAALGQWIAANNYQLAGPSREIYLRPPSATDVPITEILFPITT